MRTSQHFDAGNLTSVQLCDCYVARLNKTNPYVHHVIEINPDLYEIAAKLDAERANGTRRGPLHGIPIVSKDNIATDDGFNSEYASLPVFDRANYLLCSNRRESCTPRKQSQTGCPCHQEAARGWRHYPWAC